MIITKKREFYTKLFAIFLKKYFQYSKREDWNAEKDIPTLIKVYSKIAASGKL